MRIDAALKPSRTLQFGQEAGRLKREGAELISLGLGEPEFDTPEHVKEAAAKALTDG